MTQKSYYKDIIVLYWRFAKKYPANIVVFSLIILQSIVLNVITPMIIAVIIGRLASGQNELGEYINLLVALGTLQFVGVTLGSNGLRNVIRLQLNGAKDIDLYLLKELQQKSYGFFTNNFAGSLINDHTKFVSGYINVLDILSSRLLSFITALIFSIGVLAYYSILLGGVFGLLSACFLYITIRQAKKRTPLRRVANIANSEKTGRLSDIISNISIVKTFAHEKFEFSEFGKYVEKAKSTSKISWFKAIEHGQIVLYSSSTLLILSLATAIQGVVSGSLSLQLIILVQAYVIRFTIGLSEMSQIVKNLEQGLSEAQPMMKRLLTKPEVRDAVGAKNFRVMHGRVEFKNVAFRYHDNKHSALFDHFNLTIHPGEKVGLVGHSGSGKTTLTKMLLRFMDVLDGKILLDNVDITHIKQSSVRRAIAYVPQEPLLFHRSVLENIRYGRLEASDKEVFEAAKDAHAAEFINKLPHGYDTLVGERGMKLSGGQRQRIAIARAMLKNAPIIMLDEATSALDSISEKFIQDALWKLMKDRTAIVIAHRLSTVQKMDRIVVLDEGAVIEEGSHDELLAQISTYAGLWSHQSGSFLED